MPKDKNAKAVELLGSPAKLINKFIKSADDKDWVLEKITQGGPPHKQLQHTLVLNRLEKLAILLGKRNGYKPAHIDGAEVIAEEHEDILPVHIPAASTANLADTDKILDKMTKGPQHEIVYTALLLQIIEGMIGAEEGALEPKAPVKEKNSKK